VLGPDECREDCRAGCQGAWGGTGASICQAACECIANAAEMFDGSFCGKRPPPPTLNRCLNAAENTTLWNAFCDSVPTANGLRALCISAGFGNTATRQGFCYARWRN
jgi:hypothetical protein